MSSLSKSKSNEALAKAERPTKNRRIGALYPEIFRTSADTRVSGDNTVDVVIVHLGAAQINRYELPRVECPHCKKPTLNPYSVRGSWLSGDHVIKFYCSKCKESFAFNDMPDYFGKVGQMVLAMKRS